jgi:O-antigen/teichoic acid export membrane protein
MNASTQQRWLRQLLLFALRGASNAVRFALAIYTARYLGLADLGLYGLLVGAAIVVPAVFGFGLTDWIGRQLVGMRTAKAVRYIATRMSVSAFVHGVGWPVAWLANAALGHPIPQHLFLFVVAILFLEHLATDADDLLVVRGHIVLANLLVFVRAGLWPPVIIVWGLLDPAARTIEHLLLGWLVSLLLLWCAIAFYVSARRQWRLVGFDRDWLLGCLRPSLPFYLRDVSNVGTLYLDRFLVTVFLGLELTGVYTFFWAIGNVVHSLVLYGMLHNHLAQMISAARKPRSLATLERRLQKETLVWTVLLAAGAAVVTVLVLPFIERPLLADHLGVLAVILIATLVRIAADGYGYMLLALHRDRAIAGISASGVALSAVLNVLLLPLAGLVGAALAFLLTATSLLAGRLRVRLWGRAGSLERDR